MSQREHNQWEWVEGRVDTDQDHFKISYGEDPTAVALVGRGEQGTFVVQFLESHRCDAKCLNAVTREVNFYLCELKERDPWLYAKYHCRTASNLYSKVHWAFCPRSAGDKSDSAPEG